MECYKKWVFPFKTPSFSLLLLYFEEFECLNISHRDTLYARVMSSWAVWTLTTTRSRLANFWRSSAPTLLGWMRGGVSTTSRCWWRKPGRREGNFRHTLGCRNTMSFSVRCWWKAKSLELKSPSAIMPLCDYALLKFLKLAFAMAPVGQRCFYLT